MRRRIDPPPEELPSLIRLILGYHKIPHDGRHESYAQGKQLLDRYEYPESSVYYRALAVLARWVGVKR